MSAVSEVPVLTISSGTASDAELAAVLVALSSLAPPADPAPARQPSRWADRASALRAMPRPGPGAWVSSARP